MTKIKFNLSAKYKESTYHCICWAKIITNSAVHNSAVSSQTPQVSSQSDSLVHSLSQHDIIIMIDNVAVSGLVCGAFLLVLKRRNRNFTILSHCRQKTVARKHWENTEYYIKAWKYIILKPNVNDVHSANESRVVILYPFQAAKCSAENILSLTLSACTSIQVIKIYFVEERNICKCFKRFVCVG